MLAEGLRKPAHTSWVDGMTSVKDVHASHCCFQTSDWSSTTRGIAACNGAWSPCSGSAIMSLSFVICFYTRSPSVYPIKKADIVQPTYKFRSVPNCVSNSTPLRPEGRNQSCLRPLVSSFTYMGKWSWWILTFALAALPEQACSKLGIGH